ncbi:MAG: hypothetical protein RL257_914 [Actinomycetota bacterium]|jgi:hypothetical protein
MSIARYENIRVNSLTFGKSTFGEQTTTSTKWFDTRAQVSDVASSVQISEKYRLYQDLTNFKLNYTPNTRTMAINQNLYSLTWRNQEWRITDAKESNDRQWITFMCYRNDPGTAP